LPENPEYTWFLLSRNLSGEATAAEKETLQKWLQENPSHRQQFELLQQLWQAKTPSPEPAVEPSRISRILQLAAVEEALYSKPEWIPEPPPKRKLFTPLRVTLVLLLLVAGTWAISKWSAQRHSPEENKIVAQKGSRTRAILPDGSTVWLNAGSSISYGAGFNDKVRELTLFGEAYFDVVKQPDRPFIVHAGSIQIKVLGTSFNVKSYPGDGAVETTLIKGLVQITQPGIKTPIYLHPNQKIVLPTTGNPATELIRPVTVPADFPAKAGKDEPAGIAYLDSSLKENERVETAWLFNRLEFRDDDFIALAKKLERWYNITIHFEDEKVKQLMFNGSIESESVQQAFQALKTAVPFHYSIKGNEIFIGSYQQTAP
jgi:transmembrane sensor